MSIKIISFIAKFIVEKFKVQDIDKLFNFIFGVLSILCTLIEIAGIIFIGAWFTVIFQLILSIIFSIALRFNGGEHYDTFPECFLTGILINIIYATVCITFFKNIIVQVVLALLIAILYRKKIKESVD